MVAASDSFHSADDDGSRHRFGANPKNRGAPKHQRGPKNKGGAGRRDGGPFPLKLRQREKQEIAELHQRILLEMPPPGGKWLPPSLAAIQQQQQQQPEESDGANHDSNNNNSINRSRSKGRGGILTEMLFSDLPLSGLTQKGLSACGFTQLTQVQAAVIPHALAGRDVKAQAKTGSGKTLAFVIPILEKLFQEEISGMDGTVAIVLAPTRELAVQIFDVFRGVGQYHEMSIGCLIGGKDLQAEAERVGQLNIVVASPGRLLQHIDESPMWDTSKLMILAIDEADRLLDLGFLDAIKSIVSSFPSSRQTLVFSATLNSAVHRLGLLLCSSNPEAICTDNSQQQQQLLLKQTYMVLQAKHKTSALFSILRAQCKKKILVFVSSCKQTKFIHDAFKLLKPGLSLLYLHGRQKQQKRLEVFQDFVSRTTPCCLISTDLAARGIDFVVQQQRPRGRTGSGSGSQSVSGEGEGSSAVDLVVQFDCPDSVETHIHRVGRTARLTRKGQAVLLLLPSEVSFVEDLQMVLQRTNINPKRAIRIESKLQALLAADASLKALAQKAVASYLRCLSVMANKKVFNLQALDLEQLALCYGLSIAPSIEHLTDQQKQQQQQGDESSPAFSGGAVASGEHKKKNMSKLARLKEQIRAKKLMKQQQREQQQQQQQEQQEQETQPGEERGAMTSTKKGKDKQKQPCSTISMGDNEGEDFLELKQQDTDLPEDSAKLKNQRLQELLLTKPAYRRERLQFRADGTAKVKGLAAASSNSHIIFSEEEEETDKEVTPSHGLPTPSSSSGKVTQELREAFLQQMRSKMESVQLSDKARDRERVKDRHLKKRRKERKARQGEAAAGGVTLLDADSGSGSSDEGALSDNRLGLEGDLEEEIEEKKSTEKPKKKQKTEELSLTELEKLALEGASL